MDLSSLASSLQTSTKLTRAEKDLMEKFRAAALSISLLYKSSLSTSKRAYSAGYSTCLADVLQMIQHGLSASHSADDGTPGDGGSEMTIGRIMDWVEARQETIRLEEEDQDGINEDDVGENGGAGSAYNTSTKPRETFGDRMGSQGPSIILKAGSHSNGALGGSSGNVNNRFAQSIASSPMKRTGSAPINMRPVPLTNPSSGPLSLSDGPSSVGSSSNQPLVSSSSSSAFSKTIAPAQSEQRSNFHPSPRSSNEEADGPMLSINNSTLRISSSVPPPTRPSSVRPFEETSSASSTYPSFQGLKPKTLIPSSLPASAPSSSPSPVFPPPKQCQTSSIAAEVASDPSTSRNSMMRSSPLALRSVSLSPSSRTMTASDHPSAPPLSLTAATPTPGSALTEAQPGSFPSPKAASPILFPPSKPSFTFGLPSDPFSEGLSSRVGNSPTGIVDMSGSTANGIFSGVSIPHQVGAAMGGNGGSAGEREPTGSKRRYAAMMAAAGAGPTTAGTSGASVNVGGGGMDDMADITTTMITNTGSVGTGGGGRRKGTRRPVKAVGVARDAGSMEGVEESEEREKKRSARRRD